MGWAFSAALDLKIDNLNINEYLASKNGSKDVFANCLTELKQYHILDDDLDQVLVPKSYFFSNVDYYLNFIERRLTFEGTLECLIEDYFLRNPIDVYEVLLFSFYASTKIPDSKFSLGIGDASIFWMDIAFKDGRLISMKSDDLSDDLIREFEGNCFLCSQAELEYFFSGCHFHYEKTEKERKEIIEQRGILWRVMPTGTSDEILSGLKNIIDSVEKYAIYNKNRLRTVEDWEHYRQVFHNMCDFEYYWIDLLEVHLKDKKLTSNKGFLLGLLKLLGSGQFFSDHIIWDTGGFGRGSVSLWNIIFVHILDLNLVDDKIFFQEVITVAPLFFHWHDEIKSENLDSEFIVRIVDEVMTLENTRKFKINLGLIIVELFEKFNDLRLDKNLHIKISSIMDGRFYDYSYSFDYMLEFVPKNYFEDKKFMMEMIDNRPDSILYCEGELRFDSELILLSLRHHRDDWREDIFDYIDNLLTHKCPLNSDKSFFLEYAGVLSTDSDFIGGSEDWIYSHLSEDLKSDEKFLNELNETLGLGDKLN